MTQIRALFLVLRSMIRKSISLTFPTTKFLFVKHFFVTREIFSSILYSKYNNIPKLPSRQHIYENTNLFIMKLLKPLLCSMVSKISTPYVKRIRYFLQWRCSTNIPLSIVFF